MASKPDPNANAETTLEQQAGESPSDIKSLLSALGLTPASTMQEFATAVQKQGGLTGSQVDPSDNQGFLAKGLGGLEQHWKTSEAPVDKVIAALAGPSAPTDPKLASPADAAKGAKDPTKKAAAAAPQQSPYEQLADSLASMYLQQVNQLEPLISGSGLFGPQGQTTQAAQTAGAAVPGAAGWLSGLAAQEQTDAAPMAAAMKGVGNAEASGALGLGNAIANTGTANAEYLAAAPYQQILSELANETAYKAASTGSSAFGGGPIANSPLIQALFKQLGLSSSPAGTGTSVGGSSTAAKGGTTGTTSATAGGGNPSSPSG